MKSFLDGENKIEHRALYSRKLKSLTAGIILENLYIIARANTRKRQNETLDPGVFLNKRPMSFKNTIYKGFDDLKAGDIMIAFRVSEWAKHFLLSTTELMDAVVLIESYHLMRIFIKERDSEDPLLICHVDIKRHDAMFPAYDKHRKLDVTDLDENVNYDFVTAIYKNADGSPKFDDTIDH